MLILFIAFFCAVMTFIIIALIVMYVKRRQSLNIIYRLRRHNVGEVKAAQKDPLLVRAYRLVKTLARPFNAWDAARNLDFKLKQAGIPLYGAEFVIVSLVGTAIVTVVVYIITMNVFVAPAIGLMIPFVMVSIISIMVGRRKNAFTEQLGDCLTTVANALRAGYSFQQAMDVVAKEMEPPISTEFERVMSDITMGVTLENALEQMNRRVGSSDFDLVVTAVLIQREVGGNLAQILDTISDTINERIRMKREINALTAQGKLSSVVLVALPILMAFFCWTFNHDQMMVFVTEEMGRYAVVFAIIMEILGIVVIRKIVNIEM